MACRTLVADHYGQEECLEAIAEDAKESPENRKVASVLLKEKNAYRPQLLAELKNPAILRGDSLRRAREELQTMLFSTDPLLRERVCTALTRYYPYDSEPRCSGMNQQSARR